MHGGQRFTRRAGRGGKHVGSASGLRPWWPGASPPKRRAVIAYNSDITSRGRANFTLGHELGHYLVHRHASRKRLRCSQDDVVGAEREIERETDFFAADLLMPLDDFRRQVPGSGPASVALGAAETRS